MISTTYRVDGMTCGHCVSAVTEELTALAGVTALAVELTAGGESSVTVTSAATLMEADIAAALGEAGNYRLAATDSRTTSSQQRR